MYVKVGPHSFLQRCYNDQLCRGGTFYGRKQPPDTRSGCEAKDSISEMMNTFVTEQSKNVEPKHKRLLEIQKMKTAPVADKEWQITELQILAWSRFADKDPRDLWYITGGAGGISRVR